VAFIGAQFCQRLLTWPNQIGNVLPNHSYNRYVNFDMRVVPDGYGVFIAGQSSGTTDPCFDVWDGLQLNLWRPLAGHTTTGIYLAVCDMERFYNVTVGGYGPAPGTNGTVNMVVLDYSGNGSFPNGCLIDGVEFSTSNFTATINIAVNVGAVGTNNLNRIRTINQGNGAAPNPFQANLEWEGVRSKAGAVVATDMAQGETAVIRDTSNNTTKLYYNNAGTLMAIALA
jgi:hypothetical protein